MYVTVTRDRVTNWSRGRELANELLGEIGTRLELVTETGGVQEPDEASWGLTPAAIEAQERAMRMGGGVG